MLRKLNEEILLNLESEIKDHKLSGPLLVNSEIEFKDNIDKSKSIMYIGQETNGWLNKGTVEDFENLYKEFLYNNNYNKEFWRFVKRIIEEQTSLKNILWANTFICGKKDELGTPFISDKLEEISKKYLVSLYTHFKPDMTIIVAGPNNPYYEIIKEFLKEIDSKLSGEYPKLSDIIVSDESKDIHYTYHPNYLNRKLVFKETADILKKIYKRTN